jgi:hypothetical protein
MIVQEWPVPLGDFDMRRVLASMAISQLEQMPRVGYWRSPEELDLPIPGTSSTRPGTLPNGGK